MVSSVGKFAAFAVTRSLWNDWTEKPPSSSRFPGPSSGRRYVKVFSFVRSRLCVALMKPEPPAPPARIVRGAKKEMLLYWKFPPKVLRSVNDEAMSSSA